jgi:uncharacterized protein (TIGR02001 family)
LPAALKLALASALLLMHAACLAQWSGSVAWLSDERFRGDSLSNGRPILEGAINGDLDNGLYAGSLLSVGPLSEHADLKHVQLYAGYARPLVVMPLTWDIGVVSYRFWHADDTYSYNYSETYAALHGQRWHVRLAHALHYFGQNASTTYIEANAAQPLGARWSLTGHLGGLYGLAGVDEQLARQRVRLDLKAGVSYTQEALTVSLALTALASGHQSHAATIMSVAQRF